MFVRRTGHIYSMFKKKTFSKTGNVIVIVEILVIVMYIRVHKPVTSIKQFFKDLDPVSGSA